jgi:hypothetical protein
MRLLACVLAVLAFIYVVGPILSSAPLFRGLAAFIDERSIEAGAYFYTEVEEFSDADLSMRNSRDHAPMGRRD